jgi:hypothetical protein
MQNVTCSLNFQIKKNRRNMAEILLKRRKTPNQSNKEINQYSNEVFQSRLKCLPISTCSPNSLVNTRFGR